MRVPVCAGRLLIEIHAHDQWLAESLGDLDEFDPTGVVAEDVADGEFAVALDGFGDDALGGLYGFGQRFFNEYMAACFQCCEGVVGVCIRKRRDRDGIGLGLGEGLVVVAKECVVAAEFGIELFA